MTTQLSNCCKALIDLDKTKERPECYTCSKCGRVIGSNMKPLKDILPEKKEQVEKYKHPHVWSEADGYNQAIDDCHAKLGEVVESLVETVAKAIYEQMECLDPRGKPDWVENGNSLKQDEARDLARKALDQLQAEDN